METLSFKRAANRCGETVEFLNLASTPCDEKCLQAGADEEMQTIECAAYVKQLIRLHGTPPEGAEFFLIRNEHEFGVYYEANIFYVPTTQEQEDEGEDSPSYIYALKCETGPENWDEEATKELTIASHPFFACKVIPMRRKVA